MSPTVDGVPAQEALGSAYDHGALSSKFLLCATALGFKQVMSLVNLAPTDLWSSRISFQENAILDDQKNPLLMYSTIRFGTASKATPLGRRLYRAGVGFELAIKRSPARRLDHSATTSLQCVQCVQCVQLLY